MATAPVTEAVSCSLENYLVLPDRSMDGRIAEAKAALGSECVILGHHYQRDEVVRYADYRGDSYRLSQMAAQARGSYIVFCGVHFMAESADILARPGQAVVLPDLNAGCSMADMAEISQVEDAWEQFVNLGLADDEGAGITPITYMNSTAAIKGFCGERGGMVCTSSNAKGAFEWGFSRNEKILFLPEHVDKVRANDPGIQVLVHPECRWEVCQKADGIGSTDYLINVVRQSPAGSSFAIGTEIHLINRLAKENPDKRVITLNDSGCLCTTMFRISPQHLCWALENLVDGNIVNQIQVKADVKRWARVALDRMLEIQ